MMPHLSTGAGHSGPSFVSGTDSDRDTDVCTKDFYANLVPLHLFNEITDFERYRSVPSHWIIGIADVVQSTEAVEEGRYKAVNTAGAVVLAAVTNALPDLCFPYIFGGDRATVAVPGLYTSILRETLAQTAAWSEDTLGLKLRVAIIPMKAIRDAYLDVGRPLRSVHFVRNVHGRRRRLGGGLP
jgi:Protein of unknown function (DUF3095)